MLVATRHFGPFGPGTRSPPHEIRALTKVRRRADGARLCAASPAPGMGPRGRDAACAADPSLAAFTGIERRQRHSNRIASACALAVVVPPLAVLQPRSRATDVRCGSSRTFTYPERTGRAGAGWVARSAIGLTSRSAAATARGGLGRRTARSALAIALRTGPAHCLVCRQLRGSPARIRLVLRERQRPRTPSFRRGRIGSREEKAIS